MSIILQATDIRRQYRLQNSSVDVLSGIHLAVARGQWITIVGSSGCGKTTLLRILGLLDDPDGGDLFYRGEAVVAKNPFAKARIRRSQVGFVFQSYELLPELDALENVMLPGRLAGGRLRSLTDRATQLLHEVGMTHRLRHRPAELSGGEQQRVAIARAMMNDPEIILADEPTGNLDEKNTDDVMALLTGLRDRHQRTVIMVTHNERLAAAANKVYLLRDGRLQE